MSCAHCSDAIDAKTASHWSEGDGTGYGHHGLCCDCMDLSCGMPLDALSAERAGKGEPPIPKPWTS
jgi:hypothetical protein